MLLLLLSRCCGPADAAGVAALQLPAHHGVESDTHTAQHMQRLSSGVQAAGMCRYGAASREKLLLFPGVARHVRWTHAGLLRCL